MAQNVAPGAAGAKLERSEGVSQDGTNRSNVTPISTEAARSLEARSARQKANEIFDSSSYEGEQLRMGQVLRRVRETLGLTLPQIAAETKIRENVLMAIERMEVQTISPGYLRTYLLTYARLLGLPDRQVMQRYTSECGILEEVRASAPVPKIGPIKPERPKWQLYAAGGAALSALALVISGAVWLFSPKDDGPVTAAMVAISGARDSLLSDAIIGTAAEDRVPIMLVAVRQSWLEVRGADGTIFVSRTLRAGEVYYPRTGAGWTVNARDGGAFEWRSGDIVIGPLGPDGTQMHAVSVDAQVKRAAELAAQAVAAAPAPGGTNNMTTPR